MIIYAVNESLWGEDNAITVSLFSTRGKAMEATEKYKKECPEFEYSIEEFELDAMN